MGAIFKTKPFSAEKIGKKDDKLNSKTYVAKKSTFENITVLSKEQVENMRSSAYEYIY